MALIAFALCLVMGIAAENNFSTTLVRALKALVAMFVLGWIVGAMAQRMLDENLDAQEKKTENEESKTPAEDR